MGCNYCHWTNGHDYRCPNYEPPAISHYCSICKNGIYGGEDYVENNCGEYVHYDCLTDLSFRKMIEWLGGEVKTMDEDYEYGEE